MRFLADESCDFAVVRALRGEAHDVLAVAEAARGAKDPQVVRLAREQGRVLLTEDKDFGWYVYAAGEGGLGVVLEAVRRLGERLLRSFTVVEPGRVRVSPTPSGEHRS
jgi:predicted nuclease of predicted toxin-antitoxin system